jgi:hypothetical protein
MDTRHASEEMQVENRTPPFWPEKAARMVGKRVLVGKTYVRGESVLQHVQFHGVIEDASELQGFAVRRADTGGVEWLPPDMRAFQQAPPGEYMLRSTGEVVVDPDIVSSWIVERERVQEEPEEETDGRPTLRLVKGGVD